MSQFRVIIRKSDLPRVERAEKRATQPFLSAVAKGVNDNVLADWDAQLRINAWVEDHYDERINESADGKRFYIPFLLPTGSGIRESKVCVMLCKENYVETWRNVGSEHHWISCNNDLGNLRLDWQPRIFAEILENQDRIEELRNDYISVGILHK